MKRCPVCGTGYEDHHSTCGRDGARLIASGQLAPGTVVNGKYRIVKLLGRGGMGSVYLAEHVLLLRMRALKFLSSELSQEPKFLQRLFLEARVDLRHPNVVEVLDLEQAEDGTPFIAMEYVEGTGLREAIDAGPMEVRRALGIARGIAVGLGAAHERGIVHRDVKPENILLATVNGAETPKLLDFGIAAMKESATALSRTRGLMLTPEYAAPEQWVGIAREELDGRVDLYALGGVLYEMLTGKTALHSHNDDGWMYQHLHGERIAPSKARPELAQWSGLDALVLALLAKEPDKRPANVEQFLARLKKIEAGDVAEENLSAAVTLREALNHNRDGLPLDAAFAIMRGICNSLQSAHARSIFRRDICPENITTFSDASGMVSARIASFSVNYWAGDLINRVDGDTPLAPWMKTSFRPAYAAPELFEVGNLPAGEEAKADLYALGVVFYEILTGRLPLQPRARNGYDEWREQHRQGKRVAPSKARPELAEWSGLDSLVLKMIAKEQRDRPGSVAEVLQGLDAIELVRTPTLIEESRETVVEPEDGDEVIMMTGTGIPYVVAGRVVDTPPAVARGAVQKDGSSRRQFRFLKWALPVLALSAVASYSYYYLEYGTVPSPGTLYTNLLLSSDLTAMQRDCDASSGRGCEELGNNFGDSWSERYGIPQDYGRALRYYSKACDLGVQEGCRNVARIYVDGERGVEADVYSAIKFWNRGCDGGDSLSCGMLGKLYEGNGSDKPYKDLNKAKFYFTKQCAMDPQYGCDDLRALRSSSSQ